MKQKVLALAALLLAAASANALTITAQRPHTPERACKVVRDLLAKVVQNGANDLRLGIRIHSDALGEVAYDELAAFSRSLTMNDGKPDDRSPKLDGLYRIHNDIYGPLYIAVIERVRWENERFTYDGDGGSESLPPAYENIRSFWIVEFSSNDISGMRQADELYKMAYSERHPNMCTGAG